jgi:uncharacterized protein (DUF2236 family)
MPARERRDDGLFGPGSATWRVHSSPAVGLVGGLRSLIVQSFHPLAMAGVAQHSDYRERPLKRLRRTAEYVAVVTFGDTEQAQRIAARVRRVHRKVKGIDPVTGRRYSADDPETALYVHCTEVHSFLAAHRVYGRDRLSAGEEDLYFEENVRAAELMGIPAAIVPHSAQAMTEYFASVRPQLCVSDSARDAIDFVLDPPRTAELLPYLVPLRVLSRAAVAITPGELRRMAGLGASAPGNAASWLAVRAAAAALELPLARELPGLVIGKRTTQVARDALAA